MQATCSYAPYTSLPISQGPDVDKWKHQSIPMLKSDIEETIITVVPAPGEAKPKAQNRHIS